jgi:transposase
MATRETWAARVRDWKRSGLTAADYAEREGLSAGTLRWWSSRLGRLAPARTPPVVEVTFAQGPVVASSLEVVLVGGARVVVPVGFDETTLARLLTVLEGR